MWEPPSTRDPVELLERLIDQMRGLGSRSWQIGLTAPTLAQAVLDADESVKRQSERQRSRAKEKDQPEAEA